jgi:hypothetical protein
MTHLGVAFSHYMYPGFLDLRENTIFTFPFHGKNLGVHFRQIHRPVITVDFKNDFLIDNGNQTSDIRLLRSPTNIDPDNIWVHASGRHGMSGPLIAVEKDTHGRIFGRNVYSEIIVYEEINHNSDTRDLSIRDAGLEYFIESYKFLFVDDRIKKPKNLTDDFPVVRTGVTYYTDNERSLEFPTRFVKIPLPSFQPEFVSWRVKDFSSALHSTMFSTLQEQDTLIQTFSDFLQGNYEIAECQRNFLRFVDKVLGINDYRIAIADLISIFEMSIGEYIYKNPHEFPKQLIKRYQSDNEHMSIDQIINKFAAPILTKRAPDLKPDVLRDLHSTRITRREAIHGQRTPSHDEIQKAVRCVQIFLNIAFPLTPG